MKKILIFGVFLSTLSIQLSCSLPGLETPGLMPQQMPSFTINNRPLIKINGKTISLMDVVKKMDILIYEHFPDVKGSPVKLFQFYSSQWKYILDDMIFNELTIADGESKEIKISDGDIREEMEKRFGPNIISTLSKLGLQYAEVREMVHDELLVKQLHGMKIYSKAQLSITPEIVKKEYGSYVVKNPPKEEWTYQIFSVRGKEAAACKQVALQAAKDLKLSSTKLSSLYEKIQELPEVQEKNVTVNLSKEFIVDNKGLSEDYRKILSQLKENEYSEPILQQSKSDQSSVYRIFYLKSRNTSNTASFHEMVDELENKLLNNTAQKEKEQYKQRLLKKFGFDSDFLKQMVPDDYEPFVIR